jgi:hypothetical protein
VASTEEKTEGVEDAKFKVEGLKVESLKVAR